jgi:hypothetical protein
MESVLKPLVIAGYKNWELNDREREGIKASLLPKYGAFVGPDWSASKRSADVHSMVTTEPVDVIDAIAKEHDIAYVAANTPEDIFTADELFVKRIDEAKQSGLFDTSHEKNIAAIAKAAMFTKTRVEQLRGKPYYGFDANVSALDRVRAQAYLQSMNEKGGVVQDFVTRRAQGTSVTAPKSW